MLRKFVLVALFAMFLVPAAAQAQFDEGDWDIQIAGSGSSSDDFDNTMVALAMLGTRLSKEFTTEDVTAELVDLDAITIAGR